MPVVPMLSMLIKIKPSPFKDLLIENCWSGFYGPDILPAIDIPTNTVKALIN